MSAAVTAWKTYSEPVGPDTLNDQYEAYLALYEGTAFRLLSGKRQGVFKDQRVYRNTRLVYSHVANVVDFYRGATYLGQLATDGKRLPDGSRGAIPIDPQTGNDASDAQLFKAIAGLWALWNWQDGMTIRPQFVPMLGDGLTELVDDPNRHAAWPQFVWPGYVTDLDLAITGSQINVSAYTLEYRAIRQTERGEDSFNYRKEVTKEAYRYYKNDAPWSDMSENGHGEWEQENPYGFVPAIWDRYKRGRGNRGIAAIANARQSLYELNSTFSHAIDYQRKQFAAPVGVKGAGGAVSQIVGPTRTSDPAQLAESLGLVDLGENGSFEAVQLDIGKTLDMLKEVKADILEMNPEASFYHDLRQMSSLTGPAVERALGDAVGRVNLFRTGMDSNTVKLFQMALAMMGFRIQRGEWGTLNPRDEVYRPYNLDSYKAGLMDMTILGRPVVPQTMDERLDELAKQEALQTRWALGETGLDEDTVQAIRDDMAAQVLADFGGDVEGQVA